MKVAASVIMSVVLASYVRALVWAKHIMLVLYGDLVSSHPERMRPFWQYVLRRHDLFPAAVSLSCVDTRYCDIGDWIHYLKVFHMLRVRTGGVCYRLYCPRVPGPDYIGRHGTGNAFSQAHVGLIQQTIAVSHATVFVSTAHLSCAAVPASEADHRCYQHRASEHWLSVLPEKVRVVCVLAKARMFGWHHHVLADEVVASHSELAGSAVCSPPPHAHSACTATHPNLSLGSMVHETNQ